MERFTASNGLAFVKAFDGSWRWESGFDPAFVTDALRELFLAERDADLGRWRHPEHATFVVYEREGGTGGWLILDELTGNSKHYAYRSHADGGNSVFSRVARDYFDAHPEPEPRPWEDAQEGEVWVLTTTSGTSAWFVNGDYFQNTKTFVNRFKHDKWFLAGRRIWPEVKS